MISNPNKEGNRMFQCTAEELETYKNALRNVKTFVNKTSDHGNDVQISYGGIKVNICDDREKHVSQEVLKDMCETILLCLLQNN